LLVIGYEQRGRKMKSEIGGTMGIDIDPELLRIKTA